MQTNIQQWGNSLGVRIPKQVAKQLSLHAGSVIEIRVENGQITLSPKKHSLSDMLNRISPENMHNLEWDDDVKGNEEW
jgi:antitoxin MazE